MRHDRVGRSNAHGVVYVVGSAADRRVKIGSAGNARNRLVELQSGSPNPLRILVTIEGGRLLEGLIHDHLKRFRVIGEWFDFGEANPVHIVTDAVQVLRSKGLFPSPEGLEELRESQKRDPSMPTVKEKILAALKAGIAPMTVHEVAAATNFSVPHLAVKLSELKSAGLVSNSQRQWSLVVHEKGE
ncbi:GIY-YIG nuclease family protein [Streptomyces sp. JJ66]|uniref:GIY-YIG nuclease family protein n=1 Tax=Streptomyces sp. JJ66 TaxID=2803843 RepID=UPI001C55ACF1|nr:GIY-YIG nuclease family protein [Streptomyces sp. JJ66]MBW1603560.1 GIY-YIG nuclease family protein [Streptomyces sp. JJ66]